MRLIVFKIVGELRSILRKLLEEVDWLDLYTRQRILEVEKCLRTSIFIHL